MLSTKGAENMKADTYFDHEHINQVLDEMEVLVIGMHDGESIYQTPVHFGYEEIDGQYTFWFHGDDSHTTGRLLKADPHVGFELDGGQKFLLVPKPFHYSAEFKSVIGQGIITQVTDHQSMLHGLNVMTDHYIKNHPQFTDKMLGKVAVWRLDANKISARIHIPAGLKDMKPGQKLSGSETVYGDPNTTVDLDALASASVNADLSDVYADDKKKTDNKKK